MRTRFSRHDADARVPMSAFASGRMLLGRAASSSAATTMPGKPLLEYLVQVLDQQAESQNRPSSGSAALPERLLRRRASSHASTQAAADDDAPFVLELNPACAFYLQGLFRTMLVPTTNDQGVVTQWRMSPAFIEEMGEEIEKEKLGPAHPKTILRLAGHLLDLRAMVVLPVPTQMNFPMPSECDFSMFPSLQYVRLDRADLGALKNFDLIKPRLLELSCRNLVLVKLADLLGHTVSRHQQSPRGRPGTVWPQLQTLSIVNCQLARLDPSLTLVPAIRHINLSNNNLTSIEGLQACTSLTSLNVSQNRLTSMASVNQILTNIRRLDLSNNRLRSTAGLEKLFTLEVLNLGHNNIASMSEIAYLVSLPMLHSLILTGNPIEKSRSYRQDVHSLLSNEVTLDEVPWSSQDLNEFARGYSQSPTRTVKRATSSILATMPSMRGRSNTRAKLQTNDHVGAADWQRKILRSTSLIVISLCAAYAIVCVGAPIVGVDAQSSTAVNTAAAVAAIALGYLGVAWLVSQLSSPVVVPATLATASPARAVTEDRSKRVRTLSRRLSSCWVNNMYDTAQSTSDHDHHKEAMVALDVLISSLRTLNATSEAMSPLIFLNVCSEVQSLVSFLVDHDNDCGIVFAEKSMVQDIAVLEVAFDERHLEQKESLEDLLLHDTTAGDDDMQAKKQHAFIQVVLVMEFLATFLVKFAKGDAANRSLVAELSAAYQRVFGARHSWLTQKAIMTAISGSPSKEEFVARVGRGNELVLGTRSDEKVSEMLLQCGTELQVLARSFHGFAERERWI